MQTPVTVTSAPSALIPVTPSTSAPWLTFAASSPNTPATITFIGNPAGLAAGVYNTVVNLSSSSAATNQVLVVLTVNSPSFLVSNPSSLQFNYSQGGALPGAQSLAITSASSTSYTVTGSAKWLLFGGTTGQTPGNVTVGVDPTTLAAGAGYVGYVTITPGNGTPALLVPVVFFVSSSPQLTVSPGPLSFNYQIGGSNNITQKSLTISSSGAAIGFSAVASVNPNSGGVQWLSVSPTAGATSATLAVSVTPASLPVGTYIGTITLNSPGSSNPSQNVQVTLNVSAQPLLDLSTTGLTYNYQVGGTLPSDQTVVPNATSASLNYTIGVATNNTGNWLTYVASGITPGAVTVSVNPLGLPPGTYTGTLTFNAINGGNNPQVVNVTLNVSNNPTVSVNSSSLVFNFQTGQGNPPSQTVSVSSTSGALGFSLSSSINNTSNGVTWLLVGTPSAQSTPASFTVGVAPGGMAPGTYTGTIVLNAPGVTGTPSAGCAGTQCISVTLNVSNTALVGSNPTSLSFNAQVGNSPAPQTVSINSTGEAVTYTATAAVTSPAGGSWLVVGPPSGPASAGTPSSFFVGITSQALSAGTYKGVITIHPTSNTNPDVVIPVTLTISLGNLTVSPSTLSFAQAAGGAAPAAQTFNVTSTGGALSFTAFASNATWISVNPSTGTTPAQVSVSVNGANLAAGSYTATVNVISPGAGNSPQPVTVNLTVGQGQNLALSSSSLTFSSQFGAGAPASQSVMLTLPNGSSTFTANAAAVTPAGSSWLKVNPTSGTASVAATTLTVSVDPTGLNPGTYTGTVTVTAPGATNSPQTVNVTYTVGTSGSGGGGVAKVMPQLAFGGSWYTAMYFTNLNSSPVTFTVSFTADNGTPLNIPALGGSSVNVNLAARGTAIIEAPNTGALVQGYASVSLPSGVSGYGVFRQSVAGRNDQEAVVPFSGTTATASTLVFDDTKYISGVAIVNLGSVDTTVTVFARDNQGNAIGTGSIPLPAKTKTAVALRDIPGLSGINGKMGSADFSVSIGNLAVLGLRFNGAAFTSIPSSDR